MEEYKHQELTGEIINSAYEVMHQLRHGLDEKLYERALVIELKNKGFHVDQQKSYQVNYKGEPIGTLVPDLIINNTVIVDTKVVTGFNDAHISQMIGYLTITKLEVGLLINFKTPKVQCKRVSL